MANTRTFIKKKSVQTALNELLVLTGKFKVEDFLLSEWSFKMEYDRMMCAPSDVVIATHPDLQGELQHIPFDPEFPTAESGWRHEPSYNKKTDEMNPEINLIAGSLSSMK